MALKRRSTTSSTRVADLGDLLVYEPLKHAQFIADALSDWILSTSTARDTTGRITVLGEEWVTKIGTISVTTSGQGQGNVVFLDAFPSTLVLALCMATDAQVVRDTVPDSVAQFGFRRIDGANQATVIHFIAVGY